MAMIIVAGLVLRPDRSTALGQDVPRLATLRVPPPPEAKSPADEQARKNALTEGEQAILAFDEQFISVYNKGDTKALAAMFTEDAEALEADGERFLGRDLIEQRFAETFAANPGAKIAIETDTIRFLSPEVAKEEGHSLVSPTKGSPVKSAFTVLYIKQDGRWLISSVREDTVESDRPHDRLKDLEWMVGEWVEERSDATVRLTCRWSEDQNFLLRQVTVKSQDKTVMSIDQRIGWDPIARQIRSWDFDSTGGFGEGRWSREGETWVIKHTATDPGGIALSETNRMSSERPDVIRWVATDRVAGGQALATVEANVLVQVPPAPGGVPVGPTSITPVPNSSRSPR